MKNTFLVLASLIFYAFGAGKLVALLIIVAFAAWLFSLLIAKTKFKKGFLIIAIISYVGILIYFKYLGFIFDNLIYAGVESLPEIKTISTIGLSFFIFQSISYNIDVYRKNNRFEKNPGKIILYITMFPQLISGPLVRYKQLEPFISQRKFDAGRFTEGIKRFIIGLGKKVLIANPLGLLTAKILETDLSIISPAVAWTGAIAFALQVFFDFAGYTDMAIGVGKMLGFNLPENFNYPYISRSITEFWRRWHMTLYNWLKEYIFTPLAMNMRHWGNAGIFIALIITFFVCGIWHGPTWNFILWGTSLGFFLGLEQIFLLKYLKKLKAFAVIYSLFIIINSGILVLTPDLNVAAKYYNAMFTFDDISQLGLSAFVTNEQKVVFLFGIVFSMPLPLPQWLQKGIAATIFKIIKGVLLLLVFLLSVMSITTMAYNPFIYFRF
ncbi:MAG: hypothetical protein PHR81_09375 [Bacteroidales bacterium]|jgi:alginate O-acetyltransferase complex protein AlgI|nr:hypothetical protein [Bacteroidales bacterium]MDD4215008.1 hypothetical protein [Bacteroidales bacterium]